MPTLNWIGKEKVVNHHLDVPFKVLQHKYGFSDGKQSKQETKCGNMIIHGDNLEALKSLLPQYEGKVNCIYIDPPYNTGNEDWIYSDSVNDPRIRKWLGDTVGKEGEDLTRHDKWLCMMYPRLRLLHKLLAGDGAIFISIDDNEQANLKLMCDEIFGAQNFIDNIVWDKKSSAKGVPPKNMMVNVHEYIVVYQKAEGFKFVGQKRTEESGKFKNPDNDPRGPWRESNIKSTIKPIDEAFTIVDPNTGRKYTNTWAFSKKTLERMIQEGRILWKDSLPKQKEFMREMKNEKMAIKSNWGVFDAQSTTVFLKKLLPDIKFDNPKPIALMEHLIKVATSENAIILDSFAGSGTTAQAVLELNKEDGGNRKFILVEMMDYADSITAERNKRVITGYGEGNDRVDKISGAFDFYDVADPLFTPENELNEDIGVEKIREYIWYTETQSLFEDNKQSNPYYLGTHNDTAYYFYYQKDRATTLNYDFLASLPKSKEGFIIYADQCTLPEAYMKKHNIIFKKIPRDITKF